jgi:hypothetical protein
MGWHLVVFYVRHADIAGEYMKKGRPANIGKVRR